MIDQLWDEAFHIGAFMVRWSSTKSPEEGRETDTVASDERTSDVLVIQGRYNEDTTTEEVVKKHIGHVQRAISRPGSPKARKANSKALSKTRPTQSLRQNVHREHNLPQCVMLVHFTGRPLKNVDEVP